MVEASISGVAVVAQDNRTYVSVKGSAGADEFRRALLEIGPGQSPASWTKVAAIKKPVANDVLGLIPAQRFADSKQWTIRLVTEHKNGRTREFRFALKLGG